MCIRDRGNSNECDHIKSLLSEVNAKRDVIGYVSLSEDQEHKLYKGQLDQLPELCINEKIDEVIFSTDSVKVEDIMPFMSTLGDKIDFKLFSSDGKSIIGSNSKNSRGDFFAVDVNFNLQKEEIRKNKRVLDIFLSITILILSPIFVCCLLYTSPSPRDATLSRMPSSA